MGQHGTTAGPAPREEPGLREREKLPARSSAVAAKTVAYHLLKHRAASPVNKTVPLIPAAVVFCSVPISLSLCTYIPKVKRYHFFCIADKDQASQS